MPCTNHHEAENESYEYFHGNIEPLPKNSNGNWDFPSGEFHNTKADAFRHAYSSARYKAALEMPLMMYLMLLQTGQKM